MQDQTRHFCDYFDCDKNHYSPFHCFHPLLPLLAQIGAFSEPRRSRISVARHTCRSGQKSR